MQYNRPAYEEQKCTVKTMRCMIPESRTPVRQRNSAAGVATKSFAEYERNDQMLKTLKRLFDDVGASTVVPEYERKHLQLAVASLLHESARADQGEHPAENAAAHEALAELFALDMNACVRLLEEGRAKALHMTSYFGAVAVIKRDFTQPQRLLFIEHLWRIAYADARLDPYEDHYVRKIAHLLYVPNTQCMLARGRARAH